MTGENVRPHPSDAHVREPLGDHVSGLQGGLNGELCLFCTCGWRVIWADRAPQVHEVKAAWSDHFAELFMEGLSRQKKTRPTLAPAPEGFVQGRDDPGEDRT